MGRRIKGRNNNDNARDQMKLDGISAKMMDIAETYTKLDAISNTSWNIARQDDCLLLIFKICSYAINERSLWIADDEDD